MRLAEDAHNAFGDRVGRLSAPGGDPAEWGQFLGTVETKIDRAERECHCEGPSCRKAAQAMRSLDHLLDQLDVRFSGGASSIRNPVEAATHINELLSEARNLARQGS